MSKQQFEYPNIVVGYLHSQDGGLRFLCPECHQSNAIERTAVYRVNIGIYQQHCYWCNRKVVDGVACELYDGAPEMYRHVVAEFPPHPAAHEYPENQA